MINIIKLGYTPHACCWVHRRGQAQALLAVFVSSLPEHLVFRIDDFVDPTLHLEQYDCTMAAEVAHRWKQSKICIDSPFTS